VCTPLSEAGVSLRRWQKGRGHRKAAQGSAQLRGSCRGPAGSSLPALSSLLTACSSCSSCSSGCGAPAPLVIERKEPDDLPTGYARARRASRAVSCASTRIALGACPPPAAQGTGQGGSVCPTPCGSAWVTLSGSLWATAPGSLSPTPGGSL